MFKELRNEIQRPLEAGPYAAWTGALFVMQFTFAHTLLEATYRRPWGRWSGYNWHPHLSTPATWAPPLGLFCLLVSAVMFLGLGGLLSIRRLRAIVRSPWWALLFCLPMFNILFFVVLIALRDRSVPRGDDLTHSGLREPSRMRSIGMATLLVVPPAVLLIWKTTAINASYGGALFLGVPFALGFASVMIYNWREVHGFAESVGVACLSVFCVGCSLLVLGMEGLICLFMALLIALPFAFLGGCLAYLVIGMRDTRNAIAGALLLLPILAPQEMKLHHGPEHFQVRSSIEIAAPPERVWEHVIAFSEITEKPDSPILRSGIAYPIHATINGRGVGAVRECVFTTGAFEEPIDIWDAPNRLHFTVAKQPPVMHEMSWIPNLQPQHITREYLRSRQGQFVLIRLPNGHTLLEGTTWYELQYWPSSYWHLWSDAIIHRIHMRVLEHIKTEVERVS
jgi:hypothetical protein